MALPSTAPSAWRLEANGRQSVLEFRNRLHIREDTASAWKLGGGIAATLDGCPTLVYGVGIGGITFAQVLSPDLSKFRIFRFNGMGDIWGGTFREYTRGSNGYTATWSKSWRLYPSGPEPWQLPVVYKPAITDGGVLTFSYSCGSETGGYGETLYLDEMATGQRQCWAQTVATLPGNSYLAKSSVGYLTQPLHRDLGVEHREGDSLWSQRVGDFGFIKPHDTSFDKFQVVAGQEYRTNRFDGFHGDIFEGAYFSRQGHAYEIDGKTGSCGSATEWATNGHWVEED